MVYPIRSMRSFIQNHGIDSVRPSAIINMAHGRMGEPIVDYLAKQNIPLFSIECKSLGRGVGEGQDGDEWRLYVTKYCYS